MTVAWSICLAAALVLTGGGLRAQAGCEDWITPDANSGVKSGWRMASDSRIDVETKVSIAVTVSGLGDVTIQSNTKGLLRLGVFTDPEDNLHLIPRAGDRLLVKLQGAELPTYQTLPLAEPYLPAVLEGQVISGPSMECYVDLDLATLSTERDLRDKGIAVVKGFVTRPGERPRDVSVGEGAGLTEEMADFTATRPRRPVPMDPPVGSLRDALGGGARLGDLFAGAEAGAEDRSPLPPAVPSGGGL
jgi:hypothetical protein